jgi:pimeloyl-ACP methyl ester carboxylesterase
MTTPSSASRQVIGVDLQSHGRSAVMGFSLGGGVALRTALQHPDLVERLVLVSTVSKRRGWYPEMTAGMDAMGPMTPTAWPSFPA